MQDENGRPTEDEQFPSITQFSGLEVGLKKLKPRVGLNYVTISWFHKGHF